MVQTCCAVWRGGGQVRWGVDVAESSAGPWCLTVGWDQAQLHQEMDESDSADQLSPKCAIRETHWQNQLCSDSVLANCDNLPA